MSKADENRGEDRRERGYYNKHLTDPTLKVPKTTYYRGLKRSRHQQEQLEVQLADRDPSEAAANCYSGSNLDGQVIGAVEDSDCCFSSASDFETGDKNPYVSLSESDLQDQVGMLFDVFDTGEVEINDEANVNSSFYDCSDEDPALAHITQDDDIYFADDWDFEDSVNNAEEDISEESFEDDDDSGCSDSLYHGARVSLPVSMLLIITFAIRHGLTGVALSDLLILIEMHLIIPNKLGKSMAILSKFFKKLKHPLECHYYCSFCFEYIGTRKLLRCSNKHCLKDFSSKGSLNYFIVIPMMQQLQALLSRNEVPDLLKFPVTRKKKAKTSIEDIYDGQLYKKHFTTDGFLKGSDDHAKANEVHISLQINTDGVALFRSSKFSVWPVYFTVNELPPKCRQQRQYRLFGGIWFGNKKTNFQTFMQPFAASLKQLFHQGCPVMYKETTKLLRCILLIGTFDAPAKCLFQEFSQYNGFHGCPYCLSPGETVKTSAKGHTHAYPFNEANLQTGHGPDRFHEQTIEFAKEATRKTTSEEKQATVFGVKGFSWFLFVPKFDMIRGVGIDYMHGALLGVVKMLLSLWLNKSYNKEPWSLSKRLKEIDARYLRMKPPSCITRLPRSIVANFGHLKASELRTFLLFYSIPCLYGILPEEYLQHFILLVESIYLLLQDSISLNDLNKASRMLKHFCLKIKDLYGARYETYNVHCLLHLTERVFDLGPLWSHSCFCFEDFNGELRKLFCGTQGVVEQIVLAVSIQQKIPELLPILEDNPAAKELYIKLSGKASSNSKKVSIGEDLFALGTMKTTTLEGTVQAIVESFVGPVKHALKFYRLLHGREVIYSREYSRVTKRNSYTVEFTKLLSQQAFGEIEYFLHCFLLCPNGAYCSEKCCCNKPVSVAIVSAFTKNNDLKIARDQYTHASLNHLIAVKKEREYPEAVNISQIKRLCVHMEPDNSNLSFIGIFPNTFEKD